MTSEEREQLMRHSPQRRRPGESTPAADAGDEGHTSTARALTLKEYAALVKRKRCRWCRRKLSSRVEHYDHTYGWEVHGFPQNQWLYVVCTGCGYQWNLGKLGISK
jgi:hypothetical protein